MVRGLRAAAVPRGADRLTGAGDHPPNEWLAPVPTGPPGSVAAAGHPLARAVMRPSRRRPHVVTIWELYLDADDAVVLLDAVATLERHRAVREPMPLADAVLLLDRFQTIAGVAEQDAVYWRREADDRREEADADGGRWGKPRIASTMAGTADDLADGARVIAGAAYGAATDLARRLDARPPTDGRTPR